MCNRSAINTNLLLIVLFSCCLSCLSGCTYSSWYSDKFEIRGEFTADGACKVYLDNEIISDATTRYKYEWGHAINVVPDGLEVHTIWCLSYPLEDSHPVTFEKPSFLFMLSAPRNMIVGEGEYAIIESSFKKNEFQKVLFSYFDIRRFGSSSFKNGITGAYLVGVQGKLKLEVVESEEKGKVASSQGSVRQSKIIGNFKVIAQRRANPLG